MPSVSITDKVTHFSNFDGVLLRRSVHNPYLLTPLAVRDMNSQPFILSYDPHHQRTLPCGPRHQQSPNTHLMTRPKSSLLEIPRRALSSSSWLMSLYCTGTFSSSRLELLHPFKLLGCLNCLPASCQFLVCTLLATP
jgi:hypothetical protein